MLRSMAVLRREDCLTNCDIIRCVVFRYWNADCEHKDMARIRVKEEEQIVREVLALEVIEH